MLLIKTGAAGAQVYNLNNPTQPHKEMESPLKYQTRCITCFPDHSGFLVRPFVRLTSAARFVLLCQSLLGCACGQCDSTSCTRMQCSTGLGSSAASSATTHVLDPMHGLLMPEG